MLDANSVSRPHALPRTRVRDADPRIARWIRGELAAAPPRARSLIVTVWGDAIAPHGGSTWLSGLIRLMAPFAVNERLVRTSVYRLASEGWLAARQSGRRSLYRLTAQGARKFEHAHRRIYASPSDRWDGEWELVIALPAELRADQRAALRKELGWEGFGSLTPGMFIRPARGVADATVTEIFASLALTHRMWRLDGARPRAHDDRTAPEMVRACWNLTRVRVEYAAFIR